MKCFATNFFRLKQAERIERLKATHLGTYQMIFHLA